MPLPRLSATNGSEVKGGGSQRVADEVEQEISADIQWLVLLVLG